MRRLVGTCLLLSAILALPSVELYAQKDKKKKMDAPADKAKVDSAKLTGEFIGTLKTTPGSDRIFVLESETKRLVPTNKGGNKGNVKGNTSTNRLIQLQNQLANDQKQLRTARTPQQRGQIVQRIQQHNLQLQQALLQMQGATAKGGGVPAGYKIETAKQEIEFQASDIVKVRTLLLPEAFDDKGNVKKYTKEEKDALVGKDKTFPGYESSLEKLEVGQKVRVVLAPAPAAKKDADKDAEKDGSADKKMQVKLVVIQEEGTAPAPKGKAKKK